MLLHNLYHGALSCFYLRLCRRTANLDLWAAYHLAAQRHAAQIR